MPDPERLLPLQPAVFQILLSLAEGERHGYAIMQEANLGPATLYTSIKRMLVQGLIEEGKRVPDDTRRRYYRLTSFGRKAASAEARRLQELVASARRKKLLAGA